MEPDIQSDILSLNLEFLRLAREVSRRDIAQACATFGMSEETARVIAACDIEALRRLASCALPILTLAPRSASLWRSIAEGAVPAEALACAWEDREGLH